MPSLPVSPGICASALLAGAVRRTVVAAAVVGGLWLAALALRCPDAGDTAPRGELRVFEREAHGVVELARGAVVDTGSLLQLAYRAQDARYGVVCSVDGAGGVTLHHAGGLTGESLLRSPGWVPLPRSFELDATPGMETFALITSSRPLDAQGVVERGCTDPGVRFSVRKGRAPVGRKLR